MMKKNSYLTVTDQFCGAGGSSQGVRNVGRKKGGVEVKLAMNHWKLAIETHNTNFPNTLHDCTDISACDPRRYPSTDILITSPECTNHSLAKGKKVAKAQIDLFDKGVLDAGAERSRATMWDIPRFAEYHSYNVIIVENVVDARKWVMFDAWLQAMHSLGYRHKSVYINSMHCYPTPQSRDRMYVVFWKKGNAAPNLDFTPAAHCPNCNKDVKAVQWWKNHEKKWGKYKQQYLYRCPECTGLVEPYYYAAFNAIDWSDFGKRIGDRKKPLSPNTLKRIEYGLKKYSNDPFIFHAAYGKEARGVTRKVDEAFFTQTTFESQALAVPFVVNDQHSTGVDFRVKGMKDTINTLSTAHHMKLVTPFIMKGEHTKQEGYCSPVNKSFQTQTVRQSMALVVPWIIEMNRTGECKPATHPTATFTAGGINHSMLNMPLIVENKGQSKSKPVTDPVATQTTKDYLGLITSESFKSFMSYYYGNSQANNLNEAMGTQTCKERMGIVNYKTPEIDDCFYRMLRPHEIQAAMAFDRDYVILGNSKDKVKQCGNAVTPPVMEWLIERAVESLERN